MVCLSNFVWLFFYLTFRINLSSFQRKPFVFLNQNYTECAHFRIAIFEVKSCYPKWVILSKNMIRLSTHLSHLLCPWIMFQSFLHNRSHIWQTYSYVFYCCFFTWVLFHYIFYMFISMKAIYFYKLFLWSTIFSNNYFIVCRIWSLILLGFPVIQSQSL